MFQEMKEKMKQVQPTHTANRTGSESPTNNDQDTNMAKGDETQARQSHPTQSLDLNLLPVGPTLLTYPNHNPQSTYKPTPIHYISHPISPRATTTNVDNTIVFHYLEEAPTQVYQRNKNHYPNPTLTYPIITPPP